MDTTLQQILVKAAFIGARIGMLMVFAPFLSSKAISKRTAGLCPAPALSPCLPAPRPTSKIWMAS